METLATLIARHAQDGTLDWIGLRPERLADPVAVPEALMGEAGLTGDHARPGKRAITLIQAEHLAAIGAYLGRGPIPPEILRRNLVVSGLNLSALRDRVLRIGAAQVQITTPCAPCSRMEAVLGPGGYSAMRAHGGWCARVITPGPVRLADGVSPV